MLKPLFANEMHLLQQLIFCVWLAAQPKSKNQCGKASKLQFHFGKPIALRSFTLLSAIAHFAGQCLLGRKNAN